MRTSTKIAIGLVAGAFLFPSRIWDEPILPKANLVQLINPRQFRGVSETKRSCIANYDISNSGKTNFRLFYERKNSEPCGEEVFSRPPRYMWINGYVNGDSDPGKTYELNYDYDSTPDILEEFYDTTSGEI